MTILHLTVKKKWFDLIASGDKKIEYREFNPYWERRLMVGRQYIRDDFEEVHFRNGYSKYAPFMRVECLSIVIMHSQCTIMYSPRNGEILKGWKFGICLGQVLEVRQ